MVFLSHNVLVLLWWCHQMETFSTLLAICAGNSPVTREFPTQRPVTQSFDVFFDLHPDKRLSKQWWGWWFGTPSCTLWFHCNVLLNYFLKHKNHLTFLNDEMVEVVEILHMENNDLFILHIQQHSCWCPGDARSQFISSHGIDLVCVEY